MITRSTTTPVHRRLLAGAAALTLVLAACGDDDDAADTAADTQPAAPGTTAPPADTQEPPADTTAPPADTQEPPADTTTAPPGDVASALDTNGDGVVLIGIAAAGPADDGAYYQAVVDAAKEISEANGFEDPIVIDNIQAAAAATDIASLAQQNVDVIIVGASEIAEPLPDLVAQYPDIFWYCNCGAGFPETPGLSQSLDDGSEIGFTAGYATGLKLQEVGGESVSFIGCCGLGFEQEALLSFEMGLEAVDPAFTVTYVPTGDFDFDFDNTANATEAFNTAVAAGADAVYPYLGGAHRPLVQLANDAGIITMSAGSSKACDDPELDYQIAIKFDGGDYVKAVMEEIVAGEFAEGDTKVFKVGVDPEPGAVICDATPEQQEAMDAIYAEIAAGTYAAEFGAIKGEAYGG